MEFLMGLVFVQIAILYSLLGMENLRVEGKIETS
jgi:hypothetical protein